MSFNGNFLFDVIPFVYRVIGLVFYVGFFALIILVIIFLYKKIQNESKIDRIEKELQDIKLILENINKEFKGDLNEK